jgi:amino acid permease
MKAIKIFAVILLVIAFIFTALGGLMDMSYNEWQMTRQHLWNDGLFLGLLAIIVLLWR